MPAIFLHAEEASIKVFNRQKYHDHAYIITVIQSFIEKFLKYLFNFEITPTEIFLSVFSSISFFIILIFKISKYSNCYLIHIYNLFVKVNYSQHLHIIKIWNIKSSDNNIKTLFFHLFRLKTSVLLFLSLSMPHHFAVSSTPCVIILKNILKLAHFLSS